MKRFHVHMHVTDLKKNIAFYSALFNTAPAKNEEDYAKWMLTDPPVNFVISTRGKSTGVDHFGIQVENEADLVAMKSQAKNAEMALLDEGTTACCYARSDKYWLTDPQGLAWEQFHTLNDIPLFGKPTAPESAVSEASVSSAVARTTSACC
jgi:catechol-2,3-dioxygenase